jgi:hypothetical protein
LLDFEQVRCLANYFYVQGFGIGDRALVLSALVDGARLLSEFAPGAQLRVKGDNAEPHVSGAVFLRFLLAPVIFSFQQ